MQPPLLRHMVPRNDGECHLTVKGRCVRDALRRTFNISVFKSNKKNFAAIKHIYNESANIIESCHVAFDMFMECPINDASDWHSEYSDTRSPSLHTRLLHVGYMAPH